jgi:hypothetical protein
VASKILTRDQAEARKAAAVRFAENVLGDFDKADDIAAESLDDWIERKKITLIGNPGRSLKMAGNGNGDPRTKTELLDTIDDLQQQVDDLNDTLDSIMDLAGGGPPDDDDTDADTDDDDSD